MFLFDFAPQTVASERIAAAQNSGNAETIRKIGGAKFSDKDNNIEVSQDGTKITATTKEGKTETFENNQKGLDQLKSFVGEDVFRQFNSWVRETYDKRMKDAIASEISTIKPKNYGPAVTRMVVGNLEEERRNRKKTAEKISAAKQLFAEAGANKTENLDKKDA